MKKGVNDVLFFPKDADARYEQGMVATSTVQSEGARWKGEFTVRSIELIRQREEEAAWDDDAFYPDYDDSKTGVRKISRRQTLLYDSEMW